jgi:hypothetical protein
VFAVSFVIITLMDILQNPHNPAPPYILNVQRALKVVHYGFDDEIHEGIIVMHEEAIDDVSDFFAFALNLQFPIEKVVPISNERYQWNDERSMADNNTSGFNYRTIMDTDELSNHATGHAFDVNPRQNIYIKRNQYGREIFCYPKGAKYDEQAKGTLTKNHPLVVFMKEKGWVWGGDWQREDGVIDYQHFEKG